MSDGLKRLVDIEKERVYLRFLYILIPSMSCMYVNPFSSRFVASLMLVAVLHVHSWSCMLSSWV